jgi:hypothetical protein
MAAAYFAHGKREALREDGEFILYRGEYPGGKAGATALLLAPASTHPSRGSAQKLEHEFSLREHLDPEWAAVPLALVEHEHRPLLVLDDAGGVPLDQLIQRPDGTDDSCLAAFERVVSSGWPQLVLVSGYSGIGKSSVVNELHRVLVPPRGRSRRSACSRRSARGWPTRSRAS